MCYSFVYVGVFWADVFYGGWGGMCLTDSLLTGILLICSFNWCLANFQYIIMAAFNALGTWGEIFLLHQFRGLQVSFGLQGSREPRQICQCMTFYINLFQSTRLSRASTSFGLMQIRTHGNFNPQGSREPRRLDWTWNLSTQWFQSTRLSRASTFCPLFCKVPSIPFQSTRLSRASTPITLLPSQSLFEISIHKALASLDKIGAASPIGTFPISIHKALASLDLSQPGVAAQVEKFQSTRLSRASTWWVLLHMLQRLWYFNPQGSREPRPAGGWMANTAHQFQSTRLSRASTVALKPIDYYTPISIHKALASLDDNVTLYVPI